MARGTALSLLIDSLGSELKRPENSTRLRDIDLRLTPGKNQISSAEPIQPPTSPPSGVAEFA
jgi:hypothetical protein